MKISRANVVLVVWLAGLTLTIGWRGVLIGIPLMLIGCAWVMFGLRGLGFDDENTD